MANTPLEHFRSGDLTVGVVGLGYVGLPLSVEIVRSGLCAVGFDVDPEVADGINQGASHIEDVTGEELAEVLATGRLEATTDMARLAECDAISISVPTPLSKTQDPDVSFVIAASEAVAAALRPGQLVVLESTTYPGTTREVLLPALEGTGLTVGEDFFLCFSPERVDPGNQVWKTKNTPKVIGGVTPACTAAGLAVYRALHRHHGGGFVHRGGGDGEDPGKHLPGREYRHGERGGAHRRPARRRRVGGHRGGGHETFRFHEIHARTRARGALHPRRSPLSGVEDAYPSTTGPASSSWPRRSTPRCPSS